MATDLKTVPYKLKPNDDLVKHLEGLLSDAKSGHLHGLVGGCLFTNKDIMNSYFIEKDRYVMVGILTQCIHMLLDEINEIQSS